MHLIVLQVLGGECIVLAAVLRKFCGVVLLSIATSWIIGPAERSMTPRLCAALRAGVSMVPRSNVISRTRSPRRSRTIFSSPQSGGGMAPGGGGGM